MSIQETIAPLGHTIIALIEREQHFTQVHREKANESNVFQAS